MQRTFEIENDQDVSNLTNALQSGMGFDNQGLIDNVPINKEIHGEKEPPNKKLKVLGESILAITFKIAIERSNEEEVANNRAGSPSSTSYVKENIMGEGNGVMVEETENNGNSSNVQIEERDGKNETEQEVKKSSSGNKRRKSHKKKSSKSKKRKVDAQDNGEESGHSMAVVEVITNKLPVEPTTAVVHYDDDKTRASKSKKFTKAKKHARNKDLKHADSSDGLKLLQDKVSRLSDSFDNFQEVVIKKLISIKENWRQFNSFKKSSKEVPVDLNDVKRPPPVGYVRMDTNTIHLGNGVWLPKSTYYNDVFTAGSSLALFVKNIAVSVFGTEYLKAHSITGKDSNKTKSVPRPAIDSTKALAIRDIFEFYLKTVRGLKGQDLLDEVDSYEEYIRQKISELNRGPRTKKVDAATDKKTNNGSSAKHESLTSSSGTDRETLPNTSKSEPVPTSAANSQLQLPQNTTTKLLNDSKDSSESSSEDGESDTSHTDNGEEDPSEEESSEESSPKGEKSEIENSQEIS